MIELPGIIVFDSRLFYIIPLRRQILCHLDKLSNILVNFINKIDSNTQENGPYNEYDRDREKLQENMECNLKKDKSKKYNQNES